MNTTMATRHKILLLDDDQEVLDLYREMLAHLPSDPEVHTASSGARAIALLEAEPFTLLICDLRMPRMDGLQVLTIVRKRFPQLRTAVLTALKDEQFRSRAYAIGIDLFLDKPSSAKELTIFLECVESLLGKDGAPGFRGVQSKSLVDLIQLECLSNSSSVLKITNGPLEGKIWIQNGEVHDASTPTLAGEEAFRTILGWRTGNFEIMAAEPSRPRTIQTSYQGLLMETAQAMDEARAGQPAAGDTGAHSSGSLVSKVGRIPGIEFVFAAPFEGGGVESRGLESAEPVKAWLDSFFKSAEAVGSEWQFGELRRIEGTGLHRHLSALRCHKGTLCVGFHRTFPRAKMQDTMNQIVSTWAS